MTILELREKRSKAWEAAKAFLDSHRTEKGIFPQRTMPSYTKMEQEIEDLGKRNLPYGASGSAGRGTE